MTDLAMARAELSYWTLNFIHDTIAIMYIDINTNIGTDGIKL